MELLNNRLEALKWRMYHEGATSFSDSEIERTLKGTCSPIMNMFRAKELRDLGLLKYNKDEQNTISN